MKKILFILLPLLPALALAQTGTVKDSVRVLTTAEISAGQASDTANFYFIQNGQWRKINMDSLDSFLRRKRAGDRGDIDVSTDGLTWTVDTNAIVTVDIQNGAVTGDKLAASSVNLTAAAGKVTGTLPVGNGGTGASSLTAGKVLVGDGATNAVISPTNLHWDNANSRLGIGTESPAQRLTIKQGTPLTQAGGFALEKNANDERLTMFQNTEGVWVVAPTYNFNESNYSPLLFKNLPNDENTLLLAKNARVGVGFPDTIRNTTAPGSRFAVHGNASIGESYSTTSSYTNGLIVQGHIGVGTTTPDNTNTAPNYGIIRVNGSISGLFQLLRNNVLLGQVGSGSQSNFYFQSKNNAHIEFLYDDNESMRITNNGKVGIGTATPSALLHLGAGANSTNGAPLKFTSGTGLTTAEVGAMEFHDSRLHFTPSGTDRRTVNIGIAQTSATITFAATNGGTHDDETVTVTGATAGDVVSLGVPNGAVFDATCYTAWVSADNTVTIRFNNYSGTQRTPSGVFKIFVTKF